MARANPKTEWGPENGAYEYLASETVLVMFTDTI